MILPDAANEGRLPTFQESEPFFQLADPCLGPKAGFPFVFHICDLASGFRVMPHQFTVLPTDVQVQYLAEAL